MDCPVFMMFCFRAKQGFDMMFEPFDLPFSAPRRQRNQMLEQQMTQYINRLTFYCLKYPYQWYNFFDFWLDDDRVARQNPNNNDKSNNPVTPSSTTERQRTLNSNQNSDNRTQPDENVKES